MGSEHKVYPDRVDGLQWFTEVTFPFLPTLPTCNMLPFLMAHLLLLLLLLSFFWIRGMTWGSATLPFLGVLQSSLKGVLSLGVILVLLLTQPYIRESQYCMVEQLGWQTPFHWIESNLRCCGHWLTYCCKLWDFKESACENDSIAYLGCYRWILSTLPICRMGIVHHLW